jgi:hypothetical protein
MVREPDVLGVKATAIETGSIGRGGLLINYEGALNINLHGARMNDCIVYFGCVCNSPWSLPSCILRSGSLRHNRRHDEKAESSGGLQSQVLKESTDPSMQGMFVQLSFQWNGCRLVFNFVPDLPQVSLSIDNDRK